MHGLPLALPAGDPPHMLRIPMGSPITPASMPMAPKAKCSITKMLSPAQADSLARCWGRSASGVFSRKESASRRNVTPVAS